MLSSSTLVVVNVFYLGERPLAGSFTHNALWIGKVPVKRKELRRQGFDHHLQLRHENVQYVSLSLLSYFPFGVERRCMLSQQLIEYVFL